METQPIGPFLGINNRLPDFALQVKDGGAYLRAAVNVDIDNAGRVRRRDGVTLVQAMTGAHSVFEIDSESGYLVRDGVLYRFSTNPSYAETLVKVLGGNTAAHYVQHNGSLYYGNETSCGRVVGETWYPWALPFPDAPTVTTIAGTLHAGKYRVAVRYANNVTGEVGGISAATLVEPATACSLRVTLLAATTGATHTQVFVSDLNGSQLYLQTTVALGTATVDITALDQTATSEVLYATPMPPCQNLFFNAGRLCGTSGSRLYYSLPYRPGYFDETDGYIDFEDSISVSVANQFGTYVVTSSNTYWLAGDISKVERLVDPLPYGGIFGTAFAVPHLSLVGWFGTNGFVLGDSQGQVVAKMQDVVDVTADGTGWAAVLETNGYRRVVSNGYCMNLDSGAATTYSDYPLTSASGAFGTTGAGLYRLTGNQVINSSVDLGKHNFGSEALKRMPTCYLGLDSENPFVLRVVTPDDEYYEYETRSSGSGLCIRRVDVGKGLRENWFGLVLYNVDGADFILASVSFAAVASPRRI